MDGLPAKLFLWNSAKMPKFHLTGNTDVSVRILQERHEDAPSSEEIFSNSVRKALLGTLGESAAESLAYHLSDGAYFDPGTFKKRLDEIMGNGAAILERAILAEFFRELKMPYLARTMSEPSRGALSPDFDFERLVHTGMRFWNDLQKTRAQARLFEMP